VKSFQCEPKKNQVAQPSPFNKSVNYGFKRIQSTYSAKNDAFAKNMETAFHKGITKNKKKQLLA